MQAWARQQAQAAALKASEQAQQECALHPHLGVPFARRGLRDLVKCFFLCPYLCASAAIVISDL